MDLIEYIVEDIVKKYGKGAKNFLYNRDEFLLLVISEYNRYRTQTIGMRSMIINPEVITERFSADNIEELQKQITQHLFTQLYLKKEISESEYEELCEKM